ncbi:MAG: hypothetical protein AAFV31_15490 [Pseudomonadota bacterium]
MRLASALGLDLGPRPGIKPKAPGQRLPVWAGWRYCCGGALR